MTSDNVKSPATEATEKGEAPANWKRREMKGIPASMGALWTMREGDTWRYGLQLDDSHCNAQGFVHGGVLMTFMDHALSLIIWEAANRAMCSTVHLDSHFLVPLRAPCFVELDGQILRKGKKMAFLRGVLCSNGEDIMEATGVWSIADSSR